MIRILLTLLLILLCKESAGQLGDLGNCGCSAQVLANCPVLPIRRCQVVRRPCGCCNECALRYRAVCSSFTAPCGKSLLCLHDNNTVAKKNIGWNEFDFVGTCRRFT